VQIGEPDPALPSLLSRRVQSRSSGLTRGLATALACLEGIDGSALATVPTIFASAYGESQTLGTLLGQWLLDEGGLSPIRFVASVHNAASGATSIASGATGFTTSIAAGRATLVAALLEAHGLLMKGAPSVLIAIGDESPPSGYARTGQDCALVTGALWLERDASHVASGSRRQMTLRRRCADDPYDIGLNALAPTVRANPQAALLVLADALAAAEPSVVELDELWMACIDPANAERSCVQ
jgi:hypothetical protein